VKELGQRIQRLRVGLGLTQQQLAAPRYTRGFLATIEAGTRAPSTEALSYFAERLGVAADDLLHGRPAGAADGLTAELERGRRLLSGGDVETAVALFTEAESAAKGYDLPFVECYARYCLGEAELHQGRLPDALREYARAERVSATIPVPLRATILRRRALCLMNLDSAGTAISLLEGGLAAVRSGEPADPDAELWLLSGLVTPYYELGAAGRVHQVIDQGLALIPKASNLEWIARFYDLAARMSVGSRGFTEAERWLQIAGENYAQLGLDGEAGNVAWSRGYVLSQSDRLAEARSELRRATSALEAVGRTQDAAGAALELADVCRRLGEPAEASELASRAAVVSAQHGHLEGMAESDRILGLLAGQAGDLVEAGRLLERAIDRYERSGIVYEVGKTCRLYGDLLLRNDHLAEALRVLRRGAKRIASQTQP
jgi:tetratricopeptide (TPR) repeat protein